jgi:hypothetical protein
MTLITNYDLTEEDAKAPGMTDEDKMYLKVWRTRRAGNTYDRKAAPEEAGFPKGIVMSLTTMRVQRERVFAHLCNTDAEVRAIADRHGWIEEPDTPLDVSEIGITGNLIKLEKLAAEGKVQQALANLDLSLLRKAVKARAPDHLYMLPEKISPPPTDSAGKPKARYNPEALAAAERFIHDHGNPQPRKP